MGSTDYKSHVWVIFPQQIPDLSVATFPAKSPLIGYGCPNRVITLGHYPCILSTPNRNVRFSVRPARVAGRLRRVCDRRPLGSRPVFPAEWPAA
jgi:hypothetical protein